MPNIIIVGIGNPYRGDDGAGWVVIDGLKDCVGPKIKLAKLRGDIAELIDIFAAYKNVYLVDACSSSDSDCPWQRIDALTQSIEEANHQTSTHGFGVSEAISLAKNLDQLPDKLILYAINGNQYSLSDTLSSSVKQGVESVIQAILNEEDIRTCMNIV